MIFRFVGAIALAFALVSSSMAGLITSLASIATFNQSPGSLSVPVLLTWDGIGGASSGPVGSYSFAFEVRDSSNVLVESAFTANATFNQSGQFGSGGGIDGTNSTFNLVPAGVGRPAGSTVFASILFAPNPLAPSLNTGTQQLALLSLNTNLAIGSYTIALTSGDVVDPDLNPIAFSSVDRNFSITTAVPEPMSLLLIGTVGAGLIGRRMIRRKLVAS